MIGVALIVITIGVVAYLLAGAVDMVVSVLTWLVATINNALAPLGVSISLAYLDAIYPYLRSLMQLLGVGLSIIGLMIIVTSIREI
ncbi:MAG: hypothetical protein QXR64_06710 [Pyrobaculum sp.]